jgi:hypothetical protein
MAAQHEQLIEGLERIGPEALREHLRAGQRSALGEAEPQSRKK